MRGRDHVAALNPASRFKALALTAALCMGASVCITACGAHRTADALGLPLSKPVSRQAIEDRPESSLLYPGSRLMTKVGADEQAQPGGEKEPDPGFAGEVAAAAVDPTALLDWYSAQMAERGYQSATYYPLSTQSEGRAWTIPHTKDQIQVAVYRAGEGPVRQLPAGSIEYEEILVDYRVTGPPPNAK